MLLIAALNLVGAPIVVPIAIAVAPIVTLTEWLIGE